MSCLRCFYCAMVVSVVLVEVKIFSLSVKMSCLRCFCCARSVSELFSALPIEKLSYLGCFDCESVDLFSCVMNSEKLTMDKES